MVFSYLKKGYTTIRDMFGRNKSPLTILYDIVHVFTVYISAIILPKYFRGKHQEIMLHHGKKHYKIRYMYHGKHYYCIFPLPRGIVPIKSIKNEKGDEIGDKVIPYMGPLHNFHDVSFFPEDFGCESINIEMIDDTMFVFNAGEKIILHR